MRTPRIACMPGAALLIHAQDCTASRSAIALGFHVPVTMRGLRPPLGAEPPMPSSLPVSGPPARFEAAGLVVLVAALAVLAWWALPPALVIELMSESGPIEIATAALYFGVAAWVCAAGLPQQPGALSLGIVLCGFGARELDLHKAFTDMSVLKVSFYLGAAPLAHKLLALAAVLPVLAAAAHLVVRHGAGWRAGLRERRPAALTVAVFCATLVLSKLIDRSRMVLLEDFGIAIAPATTALLLALEECLELCLPLLVLLGVLRQRRPSPAAPAVTLRQTP